VGKFLVVVSLHLKDATVEALSGTSCTFEYSLCVMSFLSHAFVDIVHAESFEAWGSRHLVYEVVVVVVVVGVTILLHAPAFAELW